MPEKDAAAAPPVAVAVAVAGLAVAGLAVAGLAVAMEVAMEVGGEAVDYQEARKVDGVEVTLCGGYPRYLQFQQSPVVHVKCCLQC